MPLTDRLRRQVTVDFGPAATADAIATLERIDLGEWRSTTSLEGRERVLTAVLILAGGDPQRLARFASEAERDWRDVLVFAELAQPDWPERVAAVLGP